MEALIQILLVVGAALAVPAVRRAERRTPFALALTAAACTLAVRFDLVEIGLDGHRTSRAHEIAWLFVLGWVAALADDARRRLVATALILASVPGFFGDLEREALITIGMLLALWVRTVPVVAPLHRLAGRLASASLWIYLCHWQVYPPLVRAAGPATAVAGSLVVGVSAWSLYSALERVVRAMTAQARSVPARRADTDLDLPGERGFRPEALPTGFRMLR